MTRKEKEIVAELDDYDLDKLNGGEIVRYTVEDIDILITVIVTTTDTTGKISIKC